MNWIVGLIIKNRTFFSLLLTTVLSLLMISSPKEAQLSTARALTMTVFYPFQFTFKEITRFKNIFAENTRLKKDVAQLNVEVSLLREKAIENDRLRGLLNFTQDFTFDFIPVRVIACDPAKGTSTVIVNAGNNSGIQMYMPLVGERGVVGKVIQVMGNMCLVQLLKDPSSRTSVLCQRTRSVSILGTENGNDFFVQYRKHEDVIVGDTIVTSGLGGVYPRGLTVGFVDKLENDRDPLFKRARLRLSIDFERLDELFVLRMSPQWVSFRAELDSLGLLK
ncbi:MAG TPA: rod shape-determining protein MreC [Chitinispirillaceae bacterium]|nr:rod shape-determining protein MreC [Chitinispirillaceae bacterium]